jgi:nucleoside-diphosphate-sugar epimerase
MNILITGNMGYIGPSVVERLRTSYPGATLIGMDMGYFANCLTNAPILPECAVNIQHFADVRCVPKELLRGIDAIVHLAAISNDPMGKTFEEVTYEINHRASVRMAKDAKEMGAKTFIYASSCSMYGYAEGGARTEDSPLNPLTAYAKSKSLAEQDLKSLADEKFTVTCLRFSTACGMSTRLRLDLVLNDFVACAIASHKISILSDGTPWRPLINVKDMARAFDWAIQRQQNNGGAFLAVNIGSNEWNHQVKDLAQAVAGIIPGVDISINKDAPPDKRSYKVCFDLFKKSAPGYQPQIDLATTIRELKEGLETMNFTNENFRDSKLMRLKVLTSLRDKGLLTENLDWTKLKR